MQTRYISGWRCCHPRACFFRIHMQRWGLPRRHARLLHYCSAAGACPGAHAYSHGFPHSAYCIRMRRIRTQRWGLPRRHAYLSCSAAGACPGAMLHNHTCTDCLALYFPAALQHDAAMRLVVAPAWQPAAPPLWRGGRCISAFARARCLGRRAGHAERQGALRGLAAAPG